MPKEKKMSLLIGCGFMPDDDLVKTVVSTIHKEGQDVDGMLFHPLNVSLNRMDVEQVRASYFRIQEERSWPEAKRLSCQSGAIKGKSIWIVYPI